MPILENGRPWTISHCSDLGRSGIDNMARKGKKARSQFLYWDLRRRGRSQSEISDEFSVSRQAISKAVNSQDSNVESRLLQSAESSGILVEWYDTMMGMLIGVIPSLGDIICIVIIDREDLLRVHYDPGRIGGKVQRRKAWASLKEDLEHIFGKGSVEREDVIAIIEDVTSKGGRGP